LNLRGAAALVKSVNLWGFSKLGRNGLYALVVVLIAVVIGLGVYVYHEQTKPGIEIKVDGNGLKVNSNG
jgi:hypothetical protein